MPRTFEMTITCEDDDYEAYALGCDIEEIMRDVYDMGDVEIELKELARW